jgi:ABC-type Co2+ transport system permease subunit
MNTHRTGNRMLLGASAALLVAVALHGVDHSLQERGLDALTTEVYVGGIVNAVVAVIAFVLALRNHPRAPAVAAFVGTYLAVGVAAAHLAPHWSAFSDPYADLNLGFVSWAAAIVELAAAAVLAAVAFAALRQRRPLGRPVPG